MSIPCLRSSGKWITLYSRTRNAIHMRLLSCGMILRRGRCKRLSLKSCGKAVKGHEGAKSMNLPCVSFRPLPQLLLSQGPRPLPLQSQA